METGTGTLLGTVEAGRAPSFVHPGAVYLHLGDQYHVRALDLEARLAEVEPFDGDWYTQAADRHDDGGRGDRGARSRTARRAWRSARWR